MDNKTKLELKKRLDNYKELSTAKYDEKQLSKWNKNMIYCSCQNKILLGQEYIDLKHFNNEHNLIMNNLFHVQCYRDTITARGMQINVEINNKAMELYGQAKGMLNKVGGMMAE